MRKVYRPCLNYRYEDQTIHPLSQSKMDTSKRKINVQIYIFGAMVDLLTIFKRFTLTDQNLEKIKVSKDAHCSV